MKNVSHIFALFFLLLLPALPAAAEEKTSQRPEEFELADSGIIKEILKSDMILLDNDKRYRLDNVRIHPYEEELALNELKESFLNTKVNIYTYHDESTGIDRYGVPLAHIVRDDGIWLQEYLISKGAAWFFTSETSRQLSAPLRLAEEYARAHKYGFWQNPAYAIKTPENVKNHINSFQIVEGKILYSTVGQKTVFFNFSRDWKKDFTIEIPEQFRQQFSPDPRKPFDPRTWRNRTIRVRGWVESKNGPMMKLTHPEQIDMMSDPPPAPPARTKK